MYVLMLSSATKHTEVCVLSSGGFLIMCLLL